MLNSAAYVESLLACMLARLIPVNINYRYTGNELAHLFTAGKLAGLIVDAEHAPLAAAVAEGSPDLRHVLVTGDGGTLADSFPAGITVRDYDTAIATAPPVLPDTGGSGDDKLIISTGGTTGLPKGVLWRHQDFYFSMLAGGNPTGPPLLTVGEVADVVIVGGGSAGAVLAARLSQDPARTVLLLEGGHAYAPDAFPPEVLDAGILAGQGHDWGYTARATDQEPSIPAPAGKVLGGSSAVNAAVAIRARAADFAKWGAHGADGWSFADVLPAFAVDTVQQGGTQKKLLHLRRLAFQHLGEQVLGHSAAAATELRDKSFRVWATSQGDRRQPQACGPAFGALVQPGDPASDSAMPEAARSWLVSCSVKRKSAAPISASSPARRSLCSRSGRSRRVARIACTCRGSFPSSRVSCMIASGEVSSRRSSMIRNARSQCPASSDKTLSPMTASSKSGVAASCSPSPRAPQACRTALRTASQNCWESCWSRPTCTTASRYG